jgi:hypothetical protein
VHRLVVAVGSPEPRTRRATLGAAFDVLATEARVPAPEPPPERAPEPVPASLDAFDFAPIDAQIAEADDALKQARFQASADLSDLARARLLHLVTAPAVRARRVRVELLGATARLALGQDEDARSCVERALREDPNLVPDPAESPPKLQRLVSEARAQHEAENAR